MPQLRQLNQDYRRLNLTMGGVADMLGLAFGYLDYLGEPEGAELVAANTIEEKIVALHGQKRDLADSLLEGTETAMRVSADDLLELLRESAEG